mmetsp:Transcript_100794/g.284256  ORF Transcript_100794/g.284256 Transcript_100794/m.284256 type:complete len:223 (+) Transcript_100794:208-876(+)
MVVPALPRWQKSGQSSSTWLSRPNLLPVTAGRASDASNRVTSTPTPLSSMGIRVVSEMGPAAGAARPRATSQSHSPLTPSSPRSTATCAPRRKPASSSSASFATTAASSLDWHARCSKDGATQGASTTPSTRRAYFNITFATGTETSKTPQTSCNKFRPRKKYMIEPGIFPTRAPSPFPPPFVSDFFLSRSASSAFLFCSTNCRIELLGTVSRSAIIPPFMN